ncbi:hypothetical protein TRFO_27647 [Tritrichomonas foetus]|uniref:Uncharacterized protein n=1 Tax=Tritrichomonas foetus TaxID=1144522 RepID=A0A1J4K548_9EUKA|nr:hypothetical protein TRFO_27647 [Tritrichomonas foetus]|eukprot:OHT04844.1 hypothetical protein TRFO_27647 [Tritrichomonas foetus]
MSAEKLKALVEKGNLINLNIVSDSLANLLNEVATMLVDQQKQIVHLKKEIGEKCMQTEFNAFRDQYRADKDAILRNFPNIDAKFTRVNNEVEAKNEEVRNYVDTSLSNTLIAVNNRITQKTDLMGAEHTLLSQTVSAIEAKVKSILAGNVNIPTAASNQAAADDMELKRRVQKLEDALSSGNHNTNQNNSTKSSNPNIVNSHNASNNSGNENNGASENNPGNSNEANGRIVQNYVTASRFDENALEQLRAEIREQIFHMQQQIAAVDPNNQNNFNNHIGNINRVPEEGEHNMEMMNRGFDPGQHPQMGMPGGIEVIEETEPEFNEFDQMKIEIANIEEIMEEQNRSLVARIERKSEISLVERMFEKLRILIASARDDIALIQKKVDQFVEREQMENFVQSTISNLLEEEQASFTNKPMKCLACGRTRLNAMQLEASTSPVRDRNSELPSLKFTIPRI